MERTSYKKPRKVNPVSVIVVTVVLAVLYSLVQFGPPYWRKWKVKGILSESANRIYPRRRHQEESLNPFLDEVKGETEEQIFGAGVEDPELEVFIEVDEVEITVSAQYKERINHPLIGKATVLNFNPQNVLDCTRRDED
jgi:hypothetical protein